MSKPVVNCHSAYTYRTSNGKLAMSAVPEDYPSEHMGEAGCITNGNRIFTTCIVSKDGYTVETERTVYRVKSWIRSDGSVL